MRDWMLKKLFFLASRLFRLLPPKVLLGLAKAIGALLARLDNKRGKDAMANLNFAYGESLSQEEKERIIKRCYVSLVYNVFDFLRLGVMSQEELLSSLEVESEEPIQRVLQEGRPVIIVTAHYGNWELASLFIGLRYVPLTVVGRLFDDAVIDEMIFKTRERFGITLVNKNGAMRELVRALKAGRNLGIVVDQNTSDQEGILVDFFGKRVRHTPSASILARRFGAYILPAFVKSSEDYTRHTICFDEPFLVERSEDMERDILEATQRQAQATEKIIREKPDDWFWFHRRFKNQYEEIYRHE